MTNGSNLTSGRSYIVAREGWIFIFLFASIAAVFYLTGLWFVGLPFLFLSFFTVYFFRNPERIGPKDDNIVISPADGKIVEVSEVEKNPYTNLPAQKIGIFMSVFNVHVNRAPVSGTVKDVKYHPGKFLVASRDKASLDNERNAVMLDVGRSVPVVVVQIAGMVARRIVCYLRKGLSISQGERLGLIRFGSRVDVYLPMDSSVEVSIGDRVKAGLTIIGRFE